MQHPDRLRRPNRKKSERDTEVASAALVKWEKLYTRLWDIESEIEIMNKIVAKNILALDKIEERIAIMQEKIDGVDQEEDTFEELSNEEYLLADKICLEIKEYMSQFIDTDEKVVDNLCEIVMHRIVGDSDGID